MIFTRNYFAITIIAVVFIIAGIVVSSIVRKSSVPTQPSVLVASLPDLIFKDMDGNGIALSSLYGHPLVLNVWASWCQFCIKEISDFVTLQREFGDKLFIVEVNRGESRETIEKYIAEVDADRALRFVLDADDSLYKAISGFSMPETLFIDKEGAIADHTRGPMDIIEMRRRIQDSFDL